MILVTVFLQKLGGMYYYKKLMQAVLKESLIKSIKFKRRKSCRYFSRTELEWLFPCSELCGKYWQA